MIVTSSGDLGTLNSSCDFEVGTAFLPKNTRFGVPTGGANVVMMAGLEEDSAATMDFLKYLTSLRLQHIGLQRLVMYLPARLQQIQMYIRSISALMAMPRLPGADAVHGYSKTHQ